MKPQKLFPILALTLAVITSFAFRSIEKKNTGTINCVYYAFTGSNPFDPFSWTKLSPQPTTWPVCPTPTYTLCAICVPVSEIYASNDPDYPCLPMVNDPLTRINEELDRALSSSPYWNFFNTIGGNLELAVEFKP